MSLFLALGAVVAALIVGFLAGLSCSRAKLRWCAVCGATLNCPVCTGAGVHRLVGPR